MRALTLIQPMSWAIVSGTKRIENRPRPLPKWMQGRRTLVAVHGGMGWSDEYANTVTRIMGVDRLARGLAHTGIVGAMILTGRMFTEDSRPVIQREVPRPGPYRALDEAMARAAKLITSAIASPVDETLGSSLHVEEYGTSSFPVLDPWWSGPYGYEIEWAAALSVPIPCKGTLGWWKVSSEISNALRQLYKSAAPYKIDATDTWIEEPA